MLYRLVFFAFFSYIILASFTYAIEKIHISYFGSISLPDEMEIQSGDFKVLVDEYGKTIYGTLNKHQSIVFQQKGLNEGNSQSFKTYARVVIDAYFGEIGTYKKLSEFNRLDSTDINFYLNNFEKQLKEYWPKAKMSLISSTKPSFEKVANYFAIKHSYIRQLEGSPPVYVEVYRIQNNDRVYLLQFSYRISDEDKWKPVMKAIFNSIDLTKF